MFRQFLIFSTITLQAPFFSLLDRVGATLRYQFAAIPVGCLLTFTFKKYSVHFKTHISANIFNSEFHCFDKNLSEESQS